MRKVVIASNNSGKLREIQAILAPLGIEAVPQSQFDVTEVQEPHLTFVENALAKARHASRATELPALADDSGICIDVLNGAPGVHSARFAGEPRSDARNNQKLIQMLANEANRRAYYYCVLVLTRTSFDPQPVIAEGVWRGEVVIEPRGTGGFGYDPYFYLPQLRKTAGELTAEEKNAISHRGQALHELVRKLTSLPW
jgi:XTP/dITP diphosphohydrolase